MFLEKLKSLLTIIFIKIFFNLQACRLKQSDTIGHFNSLGLAIKKIDYCLFNVLNMSHCLCFYGKTGVPFLKFIPALVDKVTSPITELNPWYLHFASML